MEIYFDMLYACRFITRPALYVQANWSFYLPSTNKTLYSDKRNYFPSLHWKIQVCSMPSLRAHIAKMEEQRKIDRSIHVEVGLEEDCRNDINAQHQRRVASSSTCSLKYNVPAQVFVNILRGETLGTPSPPFLTTFEVITMCTLPHVWTFPLSLSSSPLRAKILSDSWAVNHVPFHLLTLYSVLLVLALNSRLRFSCSTLLAVLDSLVSQYSGWD